MWQDVLDDVCLSHETDRVRQALVRIDQRLDALEEVVFGAGCATSSVSGLSNRVAASPVAVCASISTDDQEVLIRHCLSRLQGLTSQRLKRGLYDSDTRPFTSEALFGAAVGQRNVAVIGVTEQEVFGGFYRNAAMSFGAEVADPSLFLFRCCFVRDAVRFSQFVSNNPTNQKTVCFWRDTKDGFVSFRIGEGMVWLGGEESQPFCSGLCRSVQCVGSRSTVWKSQLVLSYQRLVVVQFEEQSTVAVVN